MELKKEDLIKEVKKLDPKLKEDEEGFKVATFLLAGINVGADSKLVSKFLKLKINEVKKYEKNLRKNKIWVGDKTFCAWFEEDGGVSFWCDVNVAMGLMERKWKLI